MLTGFSAWSIKGGITHVQPPVSVLSDLLTVRVHLDHTGETNGALRVIPGSHRFSRLDSNQISYWKERQKPVTCSVRRGGVVIMRPLLLHSSNRQSTPNTAACCTLNTQQTICRAGSSGLKKVTLRVATLNREGCPLPNPLAGAYLVSSRGRHETHRHLSDHQPHGV